MTFPLPLNDVLFATAKILFAVLGVGLSIAGFLGWVERKQSAVMQDRIGANRADIFGITILGLFHPIADAIKLLTKEDFVPKMARRPLHGLAPIISLGAGMFCLAALPYGGVIEFAGRAWDLTPIALPMGVLAAIYLTEYSAENWLTRVVRLAIVNLSGVPSVVYGLFGLGLFVAFCRFGTSLLSGSLTLAIMILPVIITASEEALLPVPGVS